MHIRARVILIYAWWLCFVFNTISISAQSYQLIDSYQGHNFFDQFVFMHDKECVGSSFSNFMRNLTEAQQYGIINVTDKTIYIGTDYTNKVGSEGRASLCIGTKKTYKTGLFVMDASHMPYGCGVWPSWWMTDGSAGPQVLEYDTIEGINLQQNDESTLHTRDKQCSMKQFALNTSYNQQFMSGHWNYPNQSCDQNPGCAVSPYKYNSSSDNYGDLFNTNDGGTYATEIYIDNSGENGFLRSYFWSRTEGIPSDLINKKPNPDLWNSKLPYGYMPFGDMEGVNEGKCDVSNIKTYEQLRFDLYYCGWAGSDPTWNTQCASTNIAPNQTCQEFVMNNPSYFREAYWLINYMDVYQLN